MRGIGDWAGRTDGRGGSYGVPSAWGADSVPRGMR